MTNRTDPTTSAWWTVDEFADRTRRTPAAVRASIAAGDMPAVMIGRRYFIDPAYFEGLFSEAARNCRVRQELQSQ